MGKRYFIYKTSVQHSLGEATNQSVAVCEGFLNLHKLQEDVMDSIKKTHPHIHFTGRPMIDFLYEVSEKEADKFMYIPSQEPEPEKE